MLQIPISSNAEEVLRQLQAFPLRMLEGMARAMDKENELTVGHIQANYLSGPRPTKLGVRSNRLRSSIRPSKAVIEGNQVQSTIGTNVKYAGVHEYGFLDFVTVRAHQRNVFRSHETGGVVIMDARTGRLSKSAKKRISLLQGRATVRSHLRFMRMPARPFLEPGVNDRYLNYGQAISHAIEAAWKNGGES
jgi:phage gpG-like protein